jgi:hypothetical protein
VNKKGGRGDGRGRGSGDGRGDSRGKGAAMVVDSWQR